MAFDLGHLSQLLGGGMDDEEEKRRRLMALFGGGSTGIEMPDFGGGNNLSGGILTSPQSSSPFKLSGVPDASSLGSNGAGDEGGGGAIGGIANIIQMGSKAIPGRAGKAVGGAASGAASGAALGAMIGGPAAPFTAVLGGIMGLLGGLFSGGKKKQIPVQEFPQIDPETYYT